MGMGSQRAEADLLLKENESVKESSLLQEIKKDLLLCRQILEE
jgi:hypothetical protein